MKYIIKIILSISDFFTQQEIIKIIKDEFKNKKSIVLIDVGSHKGEYISSLKNILTLRKSTVLNPIKMSLKFYIKIIIQIIFNCIMLEYQINQVK